MINSALRYVLSQDVATVIPRLKSVSEVETAATTAEQYRGLTAQEQERFNVNLGASYYRDCGLCLPCPQNINIAAILRFHTLCKSYGLKVWAKKLYSELEAKADKCTKCGEYEIKCPYQSPIVSMLEKDSWISNKFLFRVIF